MGIDLDRFRYRWDRPQEPEPIVSPMWRKEQQAAAAKLKAELAPLIRQAKNEMDVIAKAMPLVAAALSEYDRAVELGYGIPGNAAPYVDRLRSVGDPFGVINGAIQEYEAIDGSRFADPLRRFPVLPDLVNGTRGNIRGKIQTVFGKAEMIRSSAAAVHDFVKQHLERVKELQAEQAANAQA